MMCIKYPDRSLQKHHHKLHLAQVRISTEAGTNEETLL